MRWVRVFADALAEFLVLLLFFIAILFLGIAAALVLLLSLIVEMGAWVCRTTLDWWTE